MNSILGGLVTGLILVQSIGLVDEARFHHELGKHFKCFSVGGKSMYFSRWEKKFLTFVVFRLVPPLSLRPIYIDFV
jgi:hypothetical protein